MAKSSSTQLITVGGTVPIEAQNTISKEALLKGARSMRMQPAINSNHCFVQVAFTDKKVARRFDTWLSKFVIDEETLEKK